MKRLILFLFLFLAFGVVAHAATVTSPTCNESDVETYFAMLSPGDTFHIPAGDCHWTASLYSVAPANVIIEGETTCTGSGRPGINNLACTDNTIIRGSDIGFWDIATASTGSFRLHNITFAWDGGTQGYNGELILISNTPSVRVDHVHFDHVQIYGFVIGASSGNGGVFDHILLESDISPGGGWKIVGDQASNGDLDWASATALGAANFWYMEDSKWVNSSNDCATGGRWVVRYNTIVNNSLQTHPTGGAGRGRGCRAWEWYGNSFESATTGGFDVFFMSSGTGVLWGNATPGNTYSTFVTMHSMLRNNATYTEYPVGGSGPYGWGYCGPSYHTGTVNTAGTAVTKTAGDNFSTSWPTGTFAAGGQKTMIFINGVNYAVASVASTSALTLTTSAGTQTGVSYEAGSPFNENSNVNTGYHCLDQPGRGIGDMLVNDFPSVHNNATGATQPSLSVYPRQAVEPVYEWLNTFASCGGCGGSFWSVYETDAFTENTDYFLYDAGFTGATGVGSGNRAARPASTTNGVGYWDTDHGGNWDTTNGSANDGCLDIVQSGAWVNCVYTPYTFPHPLADVTGTPSITSLTPAVGIQGATSLSIAVVGSNTNFVNATTICDFGANITVNSCTVASATTLTAVITISAGAVVGARDATFTTGGEVVTSSGGFTVSSGGLLIKKIAPRKFRKL